MYAAFSLPINSLNVMAVVVDIDDDLLEESASVIIVLKDASSLYISCRAFSGLNAMLRSMHYH